MSKKANFTVELDGDYLTIAHGDKSTCMNRKDTQLIVDQLVKMTEQAEPASETQVVQEPIDFEQRRRVAQGDYDDNSESLVDALGGIMADPRAQQAVKGVWGFLQTLKTTPPPQAAPAEKSKESK